MNPLAKSLVQLTIFTPQGIQVTEYVSATAIRTRATLTAFPCRTSSSISDVVRPSLRPRPARLAFLPSSSFSLRLYHGTSSYTPPRIHYEGTTPFLTLSLPNGTETTFLIAPSKPISFLLQQIQEEDEQVTQCAVYELNAIKDEETNMYRPVRWARSTGAREVLAIALHQGGFLLELNGVRYPVRVPTAEERIAPIQKVLEKVEAELLPLQERKRQLDLRAATTSRRLAWFGLGALCAQWGLMARLTWWEYSWDVMEPISYFLGAGTGILGYMFYVVTSREYTYESLSAITVTRQQARLYRRTKFDVRRYSELTDRKVELEEKIEQIRREHVEDNEVELSDMIGLGGKESPQSDPATKTESIGAQPVLHRL
ncbi:hypothetical protein HK104_006528 [Borealophlyctis nickersoniae]|nr:hypothetical protein HK104_006528 [Borealophlyctis nickersoniae]